MYGRPKMKWQFIYSLFALQREGSKEVTNLWSISELKCQVEFFG